MPNNIKQLIRDWVDIYHYPDIDEQYAPSPEVQITIGDLHANPIKLLHALIRQGIVSLEKEKYLELVNIYKNIGCKEREPNPLTADSYARFKVLLNDIQFNSNAVALVRLIGDELADRGRNDLLMLALLKTLQEKGVPYKILLSNHGIEFVEMYELEREASRSRLFGPEGFVRSMVALEQSVNEHHLITQDELKQFVENAYKPYLSLLDYSIEADGQGLTIYSHAAIDLEVIQYLAQKLGVNYRDSSIEKLAATIDNINAQFVLRRNTNTISMDDEEEGCVLLYSDEAMERGFSSSAYLDKVTEPVEVLLWNRRQDENFLFRPQHHKAYRLSFVHGHNEEESHDNIYGVDSDLGKWDKAAGEGNEGEYNVLYSQELPAINLSDETRLLLRRLESLDAEIAKVYRLISASRNEKLNLKAQSILVLVEQLSDEETNLEKLQLLNQVVVYVKNCMSKPTANHAEAYQSLIKQFPEQNTRWKLLAASLFSFSVAVCLFGVAALAMSLTTPAGALIIAPLILAITQSGVIALAAGGGASTLLAVYGLYAANAKAKHPVANALSLFQQALPPAVMQKTVAAKEPVAEASGVTPIVLQNS